MFCLRRPFNKRALMVIFASLMLFHQSTFALSLLAARPGVEGIGDLTRVINPLTGAGLAYYYGDKQGFYQLIKTVGFDILLVEAMKIGLNNVYVGHKRLGLRPNGGDKNFPSGHTSAAFSGAWFIYKRYGFKQAVLPLTAAAFTGYSRLYVKKHDIPAVITGALVGILSAELFVNKRFSISTSITKEKKVVGLGFNF